MALRVADASKTSYMAPLLKLAVGPLPLPIFSLNLDNVVEAWAAQNNVTVCRGVTEPTGAVRFDSSVDIHLYKLHGSIDWARNDVQPKGLREHKVGEEETFIIPHDRLYVASPDYIPYVIFGKKNKLTAEGPFLDLLFQFRKALEGVSRLLVIGYSFRDDHINESISRWLENSPEAHLHILDPSFSVQQFADDDVLCHLMATDRVTVQTTSASEGLDGAVQNLLTRTE